MHGVLFVVYACVFIIELYSKLVTLRAEKKLLSVPDFIFKIFSIKVLFKWWQKIATTAHS